MFTAEMVEYLKSVRTMTQSEVDEVAKTKAQSDVRSSERYEAHGHHAEAHA